MLQSPRGIGSELWVAGKSQPAHTHRRVWVVTCTCLQLGSCCGGPHAHLWGHRPQFHLAPHLWCSCQPWQQQVHRCAHLWGQRLQPAHPTLWRWGPAVWEHTVRGSLELEGPMTVISCLSGRPRLFSLDSLGCVVLAPSEYLHSNQPQSSPRVQPPKPELQHTNLSCWAGVQTASQVGSAGREWSLWWSLCFAFWAPVAAFPFEILELPHPCQRRGFWVCRNFSSYHSLPEEQDPSGFLLTLLFLLLFPYHFLQRLLLFSHSVVSDSLQPHGLQHARLPCPSPSPGVCLNSESIESVMPSNHLILCRPLLLLPWMFPSIRVFSSESALCIRWPKYCSFIISISPSREYSGLISFRIDWLNLLAVQWQSSPTPQFKSINSSVLSLLYMEAGLPFWKSDVFCHPSGGVL